MTMGHSESTNHGPIASYPSLSSVCLSIIYLSIYLLTVEQHVFNNIILFDPHLSSVGFVVIIIVYLLLLKDCGSGRSHVHVHSLHYNKARVKTQVM